MHIEGVSSRGTNRSTIFQSVYGCSALASLTHGVKDSSAEFWCTVAPEEFGGTGNRKSGTAQWSPHLRWPVQYTQTVVPYKIDWLFGEQWKCYSFSFFFSIFPVLGLRCNGQGRVFIYRVSAQLFPAFHVSTPTDGHKVVMNLKLSKVGYLNYKVWFQCLADTLVWEENKGQVCLTEPPLRAAMISNWCTSIMRTLSVWNNLNEERERSNRKLLH